MFDLLKIRHNKGANTYDIIDYDDFVVENCTREQINRYLGLGVEIGGIKKIEDTFSCATIAGGKEVKNKTEDFCILTYGNANIGCIEIVTHDKIAYRYNYEKQYKSSDYVALSTIVLVDNEKEFIVLGFTTHDKNYYAEGRGATLISSVYLEVVNSKEVKFFKRVDWHKAD